MSLAVKAGLGLGVAYILNVQVLTWLGLGLTSWVIVIELCLAGFALIVWIRAIEPTKSIPAAAFEALVVLTLASVILQLYMVVYSTRLNPTWVDMVIESRRSLMISSAMPADEVAERLTGARARFAPVRMLTLGVLIPTAWKWGTVVPVIVAFLALRRMSAAGSP